MTGEIDRASVVRTPSVLFPCESALSHESQTGSAFYMPSLSFEPQPDMWIAFGVAAVLITHYITRVRRSLAVCETELMRARTLAAHRDKLASLAALAAGAAREISQPLAVIAAAAQQLEHAMHGSEHTAAREDAQLILREIKRCRTILQRMTADARQPLDAENEPLRVRELLYCAIDGLGHNLSERVHVDEPIADAVLRAPPQATAQALRAVLKNALQASANSAPIRVRARKHSGRCVFEVRDYGHGMSAEVLSRAGEPFFTTKGPVHGTGLGLYLARAVVERAGGCMLLESTPGAGTTASLALPCLPAALERRLPV